MQKRVSAKSTIINVNALPVLPDFLVSWIIMYVFKVSKKKTKTVASITKHALVQWSVSLSLVLYSFGFESIPITRDLFQ